MLSINGTAIVTFLIVWVLVLVLTRIFFKPVLRILDERSGRIAKDREAAAAALDSYENDLRRVEEDLKEARAAGDAIRSTAEIEALKEKSRLVREVQAEARADVEKAKQELRLEMEAIKKELGARTAEIAETIEKRILDE